MTMIKMDIYIQSNVITIYNDNFVTVILLIKHEIERCMRFRPTVDEVSRQNGTKLLIKETSKFVEKYLATNNQMQCNEMTVQ